MEEHLTIKALGVDLGTARIYTTSTGKMLNAAKIASKISPHIKFLEKISKIDTKHCKQYFNENVEKLNTYIYDINRRITNKLILEALNKNFNAIALEDLEIDWYNKINKWTKHVVPTWLFKQLQLNIINKCILNNLYPILVPPYKTSSQCSNCLSFNIIRKNRMFHCYQCRSYMDADVNAAKNISRLAEDLTISRIYDPSKEIIDN